MFFAGILALIWGTFWAIFLQTTRLGRFLAVRRTWITVVIGVGVDLAIIKLLLGWREWLRTTGIIILSSLPIISRSLLNELGDTEELLNVQLHPKTPAQ